MVPFQYVIYRISFLRDVFKTSRLENIQVLQTTCKLDGELWLDFSFPFLYFTDVCDGRVLGTWGQTQDLMLE
jgi:hypothetical protein